MNDKQIEELIEVLRSDEDEDTRRIAADRLIRMARGNETAIAALIRLLLDESGSEDSRRQAAKILGEIAHGHQTAIASLVEVLDVSRDWDTSRVVADSLAKTIKGRKGKMVAIAAMSLQTYWMEEKNYRKGLH